jgi:hypothetical protein
VPKELRRVVLRDDEVMEALQAFIQGRDATFKEARLKGSRYVSTDPLEVEAVVRLRDRTESVLTLGGPHLAAALIAYCRANGIPLPRIASKSVKRVNGGIALDMTMDDSG